MHGDIRYASAILPDALEAKEKIIIVGLIVTEKYIFLLLKLVACIIQSKPRKKRKKWRQTAAPVTRWNIFRGQTKKMRIKKKHVKCE